MSIKNNKQAKSRINAFISPMNYEKINVVLEFSALGSRKLSKGEILDLALTHLFNGLDVGESLENIAINHYEALAKYNEALKFYGDEELEDNNEGGA